MKKAEKLLGHEEPFIMLNGDIFADLSYSDLLNTHKKSGALATMALCRVEDPSRYGVAELENGNSIKRFIEKPPREEAPSNFINAGVYILSPEIFEYIPHARAVSIEREIFPKLAAEGKLYGHFADGLWMDIGKPEEYLEANRIVLDRMAKKGKNNHASYEQKDPVAIDRQVLIGEKSVIGPYAIIGKNTIIGKNVRICNSVVFRDVEIGDFASLEGAIVGGGARIGKHVHLGKGCIIGDQAKIADSIHLPDGFAVCPAKEVSEKILKPSIDC